jgi:hypothetical protein
MMVRVSFANCLGGSQQRFFFLFLSAKPLPTAWVTVGKFFFFCFALQLALPTVTWAVGKAFADSHHQGQSAKLGFL